MGYGLNFENERNGFMGNRKPIKTKVKDIIDYWIQYISECDSNFDWSEADKVCWRCGYERKLYRCHIIPDSLGGKDEPSNFVLLCYQCHEEAPNVEDRQFMWDWIKSLHAPFYNTSFRIRALEEYEKIYHKRFEEELADRNIITDHALYKFWNLKVGRTSYHFGHPYGNISTITGNYKMHLDAFDKKYPNGKYLDDLDILLEKSFESLTDSICRLSTKYTYSVWEGATRNPYSLCISAFYPDARRHYGISIRMLRDGTYKMCFTRETNPNNIPRKNYTIEIGSKPDEILDRIEKEIQNFNAQYGKVYERKPFYFVVSPYWRRKNEGVE